VKSEQSFSFSISSSQQQRQGEKQNPAFGAKQFGYLSAFECRDLSIDLALRNTLPP